MFGLRPLSMLLVTALAASSAGASGCEERAGNVQGAQDQISISDKQQPTPGKGPMKELKELAHGGFSQVDQPLVIVARDETVYSALKQLVDGLPDRSPEFFRRSAIVAAFAGQKPTGGYMVKIAQSSDGVIHISETAPPRDAMVTQVLSSPFHVAEVDLNADSGDFNVDLGSGWRAAQKRYRVESGEFTMTGGITGRSERFELTGDVSALKYRDFITVDFSLGSTNAKKTRGLKTLATGLFGKGGRITIPEMHAGTLIDPPQPFLSAEGDLSTDESELSLKFSPKPTNVADGFVGSGSFVAKHASAEKK